MKKLLFKTLTNHVYSHSVNSFIGVRFLSGGSTLAIFLFNSDDNTEIHSYGIEIQLNKDLEFLRDLQDNLSFSKKSSVVIYDASTDYSLSSYAVTGGEVTRSVISSPVILNGNLNLTAGDTDYNVTAGDLTALANLWVTIDAQVSGGLNVDGATTLNNTLDVDGDVTFEGSLVDSSSPDPAVATDGSGETVTISGKDSAGAVTFTTAAVSGSTVTVTYGTVSTNTRIPVINPINDTDVILSSYNSNSFAIKIGPNGVSNGGSFTYITQDHA